MEEELYFADCMVKGPDVMLLSSLDDDDTTLSSSNSTANRNTHTLIIEEDSSYVFYRDDDEQHDQDDYELESLHSYEASSSMATAHQDEQEQDEQITMAYFDTTLPIAQSAYESAKDLWSRGKQTIGVGMVLHITEGVCSQVAQRAGFDVGTFETQILQPQLQVVDQNLLTPGYATLNNVWEGLWSSSQEDQQEQTQTQTNDATRRPPQTILTFGEPSSFPQEEEDPDQDEDCWIPLHPPPVRIN